MQILDKLFKDYEGGKVGLSGLTDALLVAYLKKIHHYRNRNIIILTSTLFEADKIYQLLLKEDDRALLFPMDDFLTSEALAISPDLQISRLETINKIVSSNQSQIVVTHLMGFLRYLPKRSEWKKRIVKLNKGDSIAKEALTRRLYDIGYTSEVLVTKTGEMGTRGFIVDVFPIGEVNPIRIEFWGDEIESIRYFDLDNQLSIKHIDSIEIYPASEFIADGVEEDERKQKYLPLYTEVDNISDYLDDPIIAYIDHNQISNAYLLLRKEIFNYHQECGCSKEISYMHFFEKINYQDEIYVMYLDNILPDIKLEYIDKYESKPPPQYDGNIGQLNKDLNMYLNLGKTIVLCMKSIDQINKFVPCLTTPYIITDESNIVENQINIINKNIGRGFMVDNYIFLSDRNLFRDSDSRATYKSQFKYGTKIKDLTKINVGDYVVHQVHGIGIYCGIETLKKDGVKKDYLKIQYKGNDKLYIPVEKIDLIWRYSSSEGLAPTIHQLGGLEWQKTKLRIRKKIHDIAGELLNTAASREASIGFAFSSDNDEQLRFEKDFEYEETRDQLLVTKKIKDEMEKPIPMDHLLCGDVGYGKTEVAFRAAFKAIQDSKQVAILCPTTILSKQHYESAVKRFKNFAINIALLNRFTTPKEAVNIIDGLIKGKIDILIGTHRILSKDIKFKNLGLLVVDEEQRFGVTHKEKIKQYKANVDVLTLSATPIPRTLQMSMLGLRHLSLIETPPMNRFPVQTYVLEYNNHIIKEAIYKELSRGGQTFILYNKVIDIEEKTAEIKQLVPDAKVTYVHGQMPKQMIEDQMLKFIEGKFDVLLCTTIIETGIDIPNVNTLIIIDADRFGLSQLYQIRGRVGRSDKIAYAYLMYNKNKVLNEAASKRLHVIKQFTALGSGFSIALRDLSIRGAGDILGSEQAGFIDSIGIELYLKMLNEEVLNIKNKSIPKEIELEVDEKPLLNVETHISDDYVNEEELKIEIHQKINQIDSFESLYNIKAEIEDRFGKISESIQIYMLEELFEKMAKEKGIEKVNQTKTYVELILSKETTKNTIADELFVKVMSISNMFRLSYKASRLKIMLDIRKLDIHWLYYIVKLVSIM
ncbi:MAG: transcription-repair coupling factor [Bacilli bacterium]|nr:transcription-repair coupling factor [Bacilli bacterium]